LAYDAEASSSGCLKKSKDNLLEKQQGKKKNQHECLIAKNQISMVEEIRQDDIVILSSEDGFSVPMIFNNLCGKNFIGKDYKDYIRHIAFEEMGLKPGIVSHYRNGVLYKNGTIPEL